MKKLFLLLVAVLTLSLCASAQTRTVKGTVLDAENDEPLIGVSVTAGGNYGVSTDMDGNFTLQVPASASKLTVSYVGYQTQQVNISDKPMVIRLAADNALLDPVIVVAYGEQKKSSFTGSAATVGSATIEKTQATNVLDALSGQVAGLQLSNASGAPGSGSPTIRVRGFSSINAGNSPLVIVDGTPFTGDINSLNTNDIESMSVLKDAASNALYGARGANGVILITTKRAKLGEAKVTVDAKWGANTKALQDYNYIKNPGHYYEAYYSQLYNYGITPTKDGGLGLSSNAAWKNANETMLGSANGGLGYIVYTVPDGQSLIGRNGRLNPNATLGRELNGYWLQPDNWMDETYKSSLRQEYNVNITQGTERSNIMASVGYLKNNGIIVSPSSYERFTGRIAADFQAKPWLKVGANVSYSHSNHEDMTSQEGSSSGTTNVFAYATQVAPIYPMYLRDANKQIMYDANGFKMYDFGNGANAGLTRPIFSDFNGIGMAMLDKNKGTDNQLTATGFVEIRFLNDFKFTSNNNINLTEYRLTTMTNPYYGPGVDKGGSISKQHSRNTDYTFQQLLTWTHTFNNLHNVNVLVGHEWYKTILEHLYATKDGLFLPSNEELNGAITDKSPGSYDSAYNNEGWLGRAQYDYDGKYFASASFRRDASSRFHPKHRWGNFWSVGAAWILSKEEFFNVDWVNLLKLKASYGEQGNDNIGNYRYVDTYELINSGGHPAATPSTKGNETITWEKNGNFNVGVEFELFNARLNGSFEGFYRKTSDMLMSFPLPASAGFMGYYANVGNMMNAGIEVDLQAVPVRTKDFTWTINANFTWYKNRITSLPEERKSQLADGLTYGFTSGSTVYAENIPMYSFWMKKYVGVDKETGKTVYAMLEHKRDDNGNIISTEEKTTTDYEKATMMNCGTALAPVYGGFGTTFEYKGFDLSANFQYQIGGQVYDSGYQSLMSPAVSSSGGSNIHADALNAWTVNNTSSNIPRFIYNDLSIAQTQSRFLTNASYLSLQNLNFGYTLPQNIVRKMYLSKLRVYFAADNVWVWSKRQGLDPRQSFTGAPNNNYYAPIRALSGGITLSF